MDFLFSTHINRLAFLARFVFVLIGVALALHPFFSQSPDQTMTWSVMQVFAGAMVLALLFYYVFFVVMARLNSIGMSVWHALFILLPVGTLLLKWLTDFTGFAEVSAFTLLGVFALFKLMLIILPEGAFRHGDIIQAMLYDYEVGDGRVIIYLLPLLVALAVIGAVFNFVVYRGLSDAQSMDNAQLARQIVRGEGYTTKFLRPQAVADLHNYAATQSLSTGQSSDLFPASQFPPGAPRILPDTYNAPGYPCLLAAWFYLVRPHFNQSVSPHLEGFVDQSKGGIAMMYSGDRWIPPLNLIFLLLTGVLVYMLGIQLFDDRVAWFGVVAFFATNMLWQFSLTALSTSFLMFLVTAALYCVLQIFCISEECSESPDRSFTPAWISAIALSLLLTVACLTRLHLLVLLMPLLLLLIVMPRPSWVMWLVIFLVVLVGIAPWFWHVYKVSGRPLGSNASLLIYGADGYKENQIFCTTSIPSYERLFKNVSQKEYNGFLWNMEHGWQMLGANPIVLLFVASLLHAYKRRRAQMFQWFLVGSALVIIAANNVGVSNPEVIGQWNTLVVLLPGMVVMGSAFFFIQLDRLSLQVPLVNGMIVVFTLVITAAPLALALTTSSSLVYSFPPYMPPLIKTVGQYAKPDEWVTTDMPWASAWYADRPSLWLPDSLNDFVSLHDNVCPTGILFFTPVSWMKPASNILDGEDKDWLPFVTQYNLPIPPTFPMHVHIATPAGGPDYTIWSDRPRWQSQ